MYNALIINQPRSLFTKVALCMLIFSLYKLVYVKLKFIVLIILKDHLFSLFHRPYMDLDHMIIKFFSFCAHILIASLR